MGNMSKKKKIEILQKRFPEFYKLATEFEESLEAIRMDIEEKLNKIEDIEEGLEELKERKLELDSDMM